jgi:hypothetical protein
LIVTGKTMAISRARFKCAVRPTGCPFALSCPPFLAIVSSA